MTDSDTSLFSPSPSPYRSGHKSPTRKTDEGTKALDGRKMRRLSNHNVAMKLFAKKYGGGKQLMKRFADTWDANKMNPVSKRYDAQFTDEMMAAHGTVPAKIKHVKTKHVKNVKQNLKNGVKRAPSDYNIHVKEFMARNKGKYDHLVMMRMAADDWQKRKILN